MIFFIILGIINHKFFIIMIKYFFITVLSVLTLTSIIEKKENNDPILGEWELCDLKLNDQNVNFSKQTKCKFDESGVYTGNHFGINSLSDLNSIVNQKGNWIKINNTTYKLSDDNYAEEYYIKFSNDHKSFVTYFPLVTKKGKIVYQAEFSKI
ncbi:hypothetical protein UJ101_01310 [Flavobacteriaceae bacterium UJ101]|nr:hypothetical protein UJ101_01310 [Flavobacteriaceae bacterium UJ101]